MYGNYTQIYLTKLEWWEKVILLFVKADVFLSEEAVVTMKKFRGKFYILDLELLDNSVK